MAEERVQKILAKAGIASRRKAEELITEGLVTINGKIAQLGDKATLGKDSIKVRGKLLQGAEAPVYLAFYKPKGVISTLRDTESRPTLADYLSKINARVFPIGHLGFMTEGLILLTNDGEFADKLQRQGDIPRVYRVKVKGHLTDEMVSRLEKGARIENRLVKPHSVRIVRELEKKSQVDLVMFDSGAIDVRTMVEMKGFLVDKITRTAIGHITLRGLAPGDYRLLKASQVQALLEQPELGMKRLEQEIEADKPKGQRKFHAKKGAEEAATAEAKPARAGKAPRPGQPARAAFGPRPTGPASRSAQGQRTSPIKPRASANTSVRRSAQGPSSGASRGAWNAGSRSERGGYGIARPSTGGGSKPFGGKPQGRGGIKPRRER